MGLIRLLEDTVKNDALRWVLDLTNSDPIWVKRLDSFLATLSDDQIRIIKKKFNGTGNKDQLIDKLYELLVAECYKNEGPEFIPEPPSSPDIFLSHSKKYIEVKNVNISDDQKVLLDWIQDRLGPQPSAKDTKDRYIPFWNKTKEHLDKAVQQLNEQPGFIFFIYQFDTLLIQVNGPVLLDHSEMACRLKTDLARYSEENKVDIVMNEASKLLSSFN